MRRNLLARRRSLASDFAGWYLRLVSQARARSAILGYLVPSEVSGRSVVAAATFLAFAGTAAASWLIRVLPADRSTSSYVFAALTLMFAGGLRRGQTVYRTEISRSVQLAGLLGIEPLGLYRAVTSRILEYASGVALVSMPVVQIAAHFIVGETWRQTLTAGVMIFAIVAANLMRGWIGHVAAYFQEYQPPQVAYLCAGAAAGAFSLHLLKPRLTGGSNLIVQWSSPVIVTPLAFGAIAAVLVGRYISRQTEIRLTTSGPASLQSWMRPRVLRRITLAPVRFWLQPGRSSGSVVFSFTLGSILLAGTVVRYRAGLDAIKPPYGGIEIEIGLQFAIALLVMMALSAPLELSKLAVLYNLFRIARVNIRRERLRLATYSLIPCLLGTGALSWWSSGILATAPPVQPFAVRGSVWAAATLATAVAAGSFVLAPALARTSERGRLPEDQVPLSEVVKTTIPALVAAVGLGGFMATHHHPGALAPLYWLSLGVVALATVMVARIVVLAAATR